jgi:hypothetical protein
MTTQAQEVEDIHLDADTKALAELASQCHSDKRIIQYFTRGHVKRRDVLRMVSDGSGFSNSRETKSYQSYNELREQFDETNRQATNEIDAITGKILFVLASPLPTFFLVVIELFESDGFYKIGLTLASYLCAAVSGLLLASARHRDQYSVGLITASMALLTIALSSITFPLLFAIFAWDPFWLYFNLIVSFVVGFFITDEQTRTRSVAIVKLLFQILSYMPDLLALKKLRVKWLDESLNEIILPQTILAINTLLGEDYSKLLVEQNSEGLRRLQDPALTIPTRSEERINALISQMDGGSIAIAGPRGAGKTTLLRSFCAPHDTESNTGPLCVYVTAPAEYISRDFLAELFQRLCNSCLRRHGIPAPGNRYRGWKSRRETLHTANGALIIFWLSVRGILALAFLLLAIWPFIFRLHLGSDIIHIPVDNWRREIYDLTLHAWNKHRLYVQLTALVFALLTWPSRRIRNWRIRQIRRPKIVRQARTYLMQLQVERTFTWGANLATPSIRGTGLTVSKGGSYRYIPWTLPELVGQLREFMREISQSISDPERAIFIGIDEIDRIGSTEQAERFINEIKVVFGVEKCFFLVSVAEDVGSLFSQRAIAGRTAVENAFDDIVVVEPLKLDEAQELLLTRVPGFTDPFVYLAHALSGGLPRELIRVARRLVEINQQERHLGRNPRLGDLAYAIVTEQLIEALRASRNQMARLPLGASWAPVFYEMRYSMVQLQIDTSPRNGQKLRVIQDLCHLDNPRASENEKLDPRSEALQRDEASPSGIIAGLSAFACTGLTVIEAFANDYFSLDAAKKRTTNGSSGSYEELAAARAELSISPAASRSMIYHFRESVRLPPI